MRIEIIHPRGNAVVTLDQMRSTEGDAIAVAPGVGHHVRIPLDACYENALLARLL